MSDVREEVVKIVSVETNKAIPKKDGGSYKGTEIKYENKFGPHTKAIHGAILSGKPELVKKISELKVGSTVVMVTEKVGNFVNLTDFRPAADAAVEKKGFTKKPAFVDNSVGMQVGNALSNATALLAANVFEGTLEAAAEMVLTLGEKLKTKLVAGEFNTEIQPSVSKSVTKRKQGQEVDTLEDDDESPFLGDD